MLSASYMTMCVCYKYMCACMRGCVSICVTVYCIQKYEQYIWDVCMNMYMCVLAVVCMWACVIGVFVGG